MQCDPYGVVLVRAVGMQSMQTARSPDCSSNLSFTMLPVDWPMELPNLAAPTSPCHCSRCRQCRGDQALRSCRKLRCAHGRAAAQVCVAASVLLCHGPSCTAIACSAIRGCVLYTDTWTQTLSRLSRVRCLRSQSCWHRTWTTSCKVSHTAPHKVNMNVHMSLCCCFAFVLLPASGTLAVVVLAALSWKQQPRP